MSKVLYECNNCGKTERPMNHRNPETRCSGTFFWVNGWVKCTGCKNMYDNGDMFWCSCCKEWSTNYSLSEY
jgi:hypothetical protein